MISNKIYNSITKPEIKEWATNVDGYDISIYIDTLNYNEIKSLFNQTEKELIDISKIDNKTKRDKNAELLKAKELKYLTFSLNYCKKNINNEQYKLLNDFANLLYFYKHRNKDTDNKFENKSWSELLDKNNICWELQNKVSSFTDNYENKSFYLYQLLEKEGIKINNSQNRRKELLEDFSKEIENTQDVKNEDNIIEEKQDYIVYDKNNIDTFHHIKATKERVRDRIINTLDMSKEWVYYSLDYLLKKHKEIADKNPEADYEFHYKEDIKNNPSSFIEILKQIENDNKKQTSSDSTQNYEFEEIVSLAR